jgi:hypothetical protein
MRKREGGKRGKREIRKEKKLHQPGRLCPRPVLLLPLLSSAITHCQVTHPAFPKPSVQLSVVDQG